MRRALHRSRRRTRGAGAHAPRPNGTIEVEPIGGLRLSRPLHARSAIAGLGSGDALLTIRPTAVRICLPDADEHHVLGTVTDVAFRDRGYEHAIDLPGQT